MPLEMFKKAMGIKSDKDITEKEKKKAGDRLNTPDRRTNSGNVMQQDMLKELDKEKKKKQK